MSYLLKTLLQNILKAVLFYYRLYTFLVYITENVEYGKYMGFLYALALFVGLKPMKGMRTANLLSLTVVTILSSVFRTFREIKIGFIQIVLEDCGCC